MSSHVQFDEAASRHSTSTTSDGSVLTAILRSAATAGVDAPSELYNEALSLANDGHYGEARARLQVLLGLAPADGDARLLLAKVHVAGQQWRRALTELDEAATCGAVVPDVLRETVVRHLHAEFEDASLGDEREQRVQSEVGRLRSEARRLRSENAHLVATNRTLEREAARWAWVATATSVVAIAFLVSRMVFGAPATDAPAVADATPATPAPTAPITMPTPVPAHAAPTEVTAAPAPAAVPTPAPADDVIVRDPGLGGAATAALADLGLGGDVKAVVRGSEARLAGNVPSHAALKSAVAAVQGVSGIETVHAEALVNTARRDGTTYVVRSGDSLSDIAYDMYGDQSLYDRILSANPALGGKPNLSIDQKLAIPPIRD